MTEQSYTLKDGTVIYVRLQTSDDAVHLKRAFDKLSANSKRLRYFSIANALSDKDWEHYLDTDNINRAAVVAYKKENDEIYGIGVARYFRTEDKPEVAEAGITVIDEFHHKGIGKILLAHLAAHAKENGISTFRAEIHSSNTNMLNMLRNLPHTVARLEDNVLRLEYGI
ncbi:MAG: hypothetical protein POELPBGB_02845 [Bacteroidia bacterium]|nr:hypothetical protein [Bacteroidia bacterium]